MDFSRKDIKVNTLYYMTSLIRTKDKMIGTFSNDFWYDRVWKAYASKFKKKKKKHDKSKVIVLF